MKMLPFVLETMIKRRFNRLQLNTRFIAISVSYFWLKFSNIHLSWDYIIYPWVLSVGLELIYVNIFEKQGMSSKFFYEIFLSLGKHVHGWVLIDLLFGSRLPLVLVNYQQTDKKTDKQIDDFSDWIFSEYSYSNYTYFFWKISLIFQIYLPYDWILLYIFQYVGFGK